jgi:hypothetical protein
MQQSPVSRLAGNPVLPHLAQLLLLNCKSSTPLKGLDNL